MSAIALECRQLPYRTAPQQTAASSLRAGHGDGDACRIGRRYRVGDRIGNRASTGNHAHRYRPVSVRHIGDQIIATGVSRRNVLTTAVGDGCDGGSGEGALATGDDAGDRPERRGGRRGGETARSGGHGDAQKNRAASKRECHAWRTVVEHRASLIFVKPIPLRRARGARVTGRRWNTWSSRYLLGGGFSHGQPVCAFPAGLRPID